MLKRDVVGWSHNFIRKKCPKCGVDNKIMLVQVQKRIKLGPIKLFNLGPRGFGRECYACADKSEPTPGDLNTAKTLEYYFKRDLDTSGIIAQSKSGNRKYPILDEKTRSMIQKENRKEGLISGAIGTGIAFVLSIWFDWWVWVFWLVWLGGLYAFFEDPEMKHRANIEKVGKVFDGKSSLKSKRSLR